jgi:hypothetical protein
VTDMSEISKTTGLPYSETERNTWAGMAHFAGTGPPGRTCRECVSWLHTGYSSVGMIRKAACEKYQKMMRDQNSPKFPHYLRACKYFALNPHAPTAHERGMEE